MAILSCQGRCFRFPRLYLVAESMSVHEHHTTHPFVRLSSMTLCPITCVFLERFIRHRIYVLQSSTNLNTDFEVGSLYPESVLWC